MPKQYHYVSIMNQKVTNTGNKGTIKFKAVIEIHVQTTSNSMEHISIIRVFGFGSTKIQALSWTFEKAIRRVNEGTLLGEDGNINHLVA